MSQVLLPLLIFTFGPVSGAHFNPMVTATFVATRMMVSWFSRYTLSHKCSNTCSPGLPDVVTVTCTRQEYLVAYMNVCNMAGHSMCQAQCNMVTC